ncbi:heme biosynthesis protein HemY [Oricola cellulosilytica]|uniref:Heme biosynthesis protein HemY n=1 Tax=Oricola cellulosilytica TaxID=1429082 RepID=A0A4R0PG20_9HYPH|nr:heme biosynthesis protein HemY [Oricola cellulosilytica]TCD15883.1 heme biosynthesis protein HemY [Oricola cellulosilytica]
MLRVLFFIIVVALFGLGFAWLADTPGTIVLTIAGQQVTVSLMVAAVAFVATLVTVMVLWWLFRVIFTSPQRMQRFFRARRRDRGYQSLSTGIIAAGAGDSHTARRMLKQANGLLDSSSEPLIQLLDAQASMVDGDHEQARGKFEAMLEDPELRMLGLRGLYMEAKRLGDREAARHYAERAAELAPHLSWAGNAALELKTAAGDWNGALRLLDSQKSAGQLARDAAKRKRAVLLTAMALENLEHDPAKAKSAALEAHRHAPDLAPAAVAAAQAAFRLNDMRKGVSVLESTWKKAPHPDVALTYIDARPGDSALDRYKRARRLERLKPNHTESSMIVAQMALEAGEYEDARKAVASVLRNEPREGAFMLMADIEEAETGDQGKMREWLARAVRAPRDPAWTADGYVSEKWLPVSPITGRLDAFEWKTPVERLGPVLENDLDPMVPGISVNRAEAPAGAKPAEPVETEAAPVTRPVPEGPAKPVEPLPAATAPADNVIEHESDESVPSAAKAEETETEADKAETKGAEVIELAAVESRPETVETDDDAPSVGNTKPHEPGEAGKDTPTEKTTRAAAVTASAEKGSPPPIPDDPGIDADEPQEEAKRRFRLF